MSDRPAAPPSGRLPAWPRAEHGTLGLIMVVALLLRLALAAGAPGPGIADPTYYFNVARGLAAGQGFEVDFIWQFHNPPADVVHQTDYYPPLTAILAAATMRVFGSTVLAALIPFILLGGVLLPLVAYALAGAFGLSGSARLVAPALVAFIPELVLNSVRTDTTIPYACFAGLTLLGLYRGLAAPQTRSRWRWLMLAGACAGLAYLTRLDGLLLVPTAIVSAAIFAALRVSHLRVSHALAFGAPFVLVVAPWLARNQAVLGTLFPVRLGQTMFVTTVLDLFSYGRTFTLESYLAWGPANILGKIGFEALGNIKTMIVILSALAPLALAGTLLLFMASAERRPRLHVLVPAGVFLLGVYTYYTVLVPFMSQSGSFKKTVMTLIPFAAAIGAWLVGSFVTAARARAALVAVTCALLVFFSLDLTRTDFQGITRYEAVLAGIMEAAREAGDANGDGRIVVMTQDPFQWNYHGFSAVMLPNDDRETIFAVAARYAADYFIFPADRAALDAMQFGEEDDPRLILIWEGARQGTRLYRFSP
jgi:4-amino-4-deoxy-L-arabinose transferase-like glycosyltransferase